jgi:hypothetical protein
MAGVYSFFGIQELPQKQTSAAKAGDDSAAVAARLKVVPFPKPV